MAGWIGDDVLCSLLGVSFAIVLDYKDVHTSQEDETSREEEWNDFD